MTLTFDRRTVVCWLAPTVEPERWRGKPVWFLCPVVAHRVLLAESMVQGLNMFERLVLDLARAGIRSKEEIAARSGLPAPLVGLIVDELMAKALLSELLVPTESAERELEAVEEEEAPSTPAMVFSNPWTGALWPRVALGEPPQAREAHLKLRDGGIVCPFAAGDVAHPIRGEAVALCDGDLVAPRQPRARQILDALRLHRGAFHSYRDRNERLSESLRPMKAARALVTTAPPIPMYLLTFAYVPLESVVTDGWTAADPFGLGRSDEMAQCIRQALEDNHAVRSQLDRLVERAGEHLRGEADEVRFKAHAAAYGRVKARMGCDRAAMRVGWDALFDLLVAAEREVSEGRGKAGDLAGNTASRIYIALEELFAKILKLYGPPASIAHLDPQDRARNRAILEGCAAGMGFEIPEDETGPSMLALGWGKVNSVVGFSARGLAPLVAACIIAADQQDSHPLRSLARYWPGALGFIQGVIVSRNPESHGEGSANRPSGERLMQDIYRLIVGLGVIDTASDQGVERSSAADQLHGDLSMRLRLNAIHQVQRRYLMKLELYDALRTRLIRMHYRLEWLKDAESGGAWDLSRCTSTEFLREGAPAVECILLELLRSGRSHADPAVLADEKAPGRIAVELGFTLREDKVIYSRPDNVRSTLANHRGSIAALLRAVLCAAHADQEHPLRDLATLRPSWVDDIAQVERARGHADTPIESAAEAWRLAELVHGIVEPALAAMSGDFSAAHELGNTNHA
jgi:hypothetical protein